MFSFFCLQIFTKSRFTKEKDYENNFDNLGKKNKNYSSLSFSRWKFILENPSTKSFQ